MFTRDSSAVKTNCGVQSSDAACSMQDMFQQVIANPGRAKTIGTWLVGSAVVQFAIAYQMWGTRGEHNRVCGKLETVIWMMNEDSSVSIDLRILFLKHLHGRPSSQRRSALTRKQSEIAALVDFGGSCSHQLCVLCFRY